MADFLTEMAGASRARVRTEAPDADALARTIETLAPPKPLQLERFDVIAEIKKTSPAEGTLDPDVDVAGRAALYESAGAAAVSVLTEPARFHGALADLESASRALERAPAMRKDFLVDPLQVLQARAAGAGGVLLITAMLDDAALESMLRCALDEDMFVLIEAFDAADIGRMNALLSASDVQRAAEAKQLLFGVNSRDLRTLQVDMTRLETLAPLLSNAVTKVAESGVTSATSAASVAALGYQAALVGTAFMRASSPASLLSDMRAAGSAAL